MKITIAKKNKASLGISQFEPGIIPKKPTLSKEFWTPADGVTQSLLAEFLSCRERATLSYKKAWSTVQTSNALTFGTLTHSVLEKCYIYLSQKVLDWRLENIIDNTCREYKELISKDRLWTPEDEQTLEMNKGFLLVLLPGYWRKYQKLDSKKTFLAVEKEFKNPWKENVPLRGKIDIAYEQNGELWIMDHKTKSILNDETENRLSFDLQGMFYILNWQLSTGKLPNGFIQNILQRPRQRKSDGETLKHFIDRIEGGMDDTYYKRITMTINQKEFNYWLRSEFTPMMDELLGWAAGTFPNYRNPTACETRYGACKFIRTCGLKNFDGLYQRKVTFPELEL